MGAAVPQLYQNSPTFHFKRGRKRKLKALGDVRDFSPLKIQTG